MAKRNRSVNYGAVTRGARSIRTLAARTGGQPASRLLKPGSNSYRSIRTLIKRNEAKGITMPEARQALLTAGNIKVDGNGPSGARTLAKARPSVSGQNQTRIRKAPKLGSLRRRNSGV